MEYEAEPVTVPELRRTWIPGDAIDRKFDCLFTSERRKLSLYSSLTPNVGRNSNSRVGRSPVGSGIGSATVGPEGIVLAGGVRGETSVGNVPGVGGPMITPGT